MLKKTHTANMVDQFHQWGLHILLLSTTICKEAQGRCLAHIVIVSSYMITTMPNSCNVLVKQKNNTYWKVH